MSSDTPNAQAGADSVLMLKLTTYFHHNRFAMDTAEGLALWIGSSQDSTARAAEALVSDGILVRRGDPTRAIYALARGTAVQQRVMQLIQRS